ncbi:MAG: hypothetical protein LBU05_03790, partial [Bifidobacteriaceae bacterium]|nr:hypothetical protein [Bifidobacteriaceae bacterium]
MMVEDVVALGRGDALICGDGIGGTVRLAGEDGTVAETTLETGVRILTERRADARSFTIGFWVVVGSRDEAAGQFGSTRSEE